MSTETNIYHPVSHHRTERYHRPRYFKTQKVHRKRATILSLLKFQHEGQKEGLYISLETDARVVLYEALAGGHPHL